MILQKSDWLYWDILDYWENKLISFRNIVRADTSTMIIEYLPNSLPSCDDLPKRVPFVDVGGEVLTKVVRHPFRISLKASVPEAIKAAFPEFVRPTEPSLQEQGVPECPAWKA